MDPKLPTATGTRTAVLAALGLLVGVLLVAGGATADEDGLEASLDPAHVAPTLVSPEEPLTIHVHTQAQAPEDLSHVSIASPRYFDLTAEQPDAPDGYVARYEMGPDGRAWANFTALDANRGLDATAEETFPVRFGEIGLQGTHTWGWKVLARDLSNQEDPLEDNPRIYVDREPPRVETSAIVSDLADGWTNDPQIEYAWQVAEPCPSEKAFPPGCPVTKVLSIQDPEGDQHQTDVTKALESQARQQAPVELPSGADGVYMFNLTATDGAGLTTVGTEHTVKLDQQAPTTTVTLEPPSPTGVAGWYDEVPTATLACSDAEPASGCDTTTYTLDGTEAADQGGSLQLADPGIHTLNASSTDVAGNQGPSTETTIKVDTTAPDHTIELGDPQGDGDWFTSIPSVQLTCEDGSDGSGCQTLQYRSHGDTDWQPYEGPLEITAEGVHELETQAVDEAGNARTDDATVRFDATDPTVAIHQPAPGSLESGPDLTLDHTAADAHLVETVCELDDEPNRDCTGTSSITFTNVSEGPHDLTVTARDRAGHTTTLTRTVGVDRTPPEIVELSAPENLTTGSTLAADVDAADAIGLSTIELVRDGEPLANRSFDLATSANVTLETTVDTLGNHTYTVRATDGVDRTAERTLTVETVAEPPDDDEPDGSDDADDEPTRDRERNIPHTLDLLDRDEEEEQAGAGTTTDGASDDPAPEAPVPLEPNEDATGGDDGVLEARIEPRGHEMPTVTSSQMGLSLDLDLASPAPARVRLSPTDTPSPDRPEIGLPTLERFDLSVDATGDEPLEIEQAKLGFSLPASTFEDPGSSPDDIVVFHWTGTYWERLPVNHEGLEADEHRFSAVTGSFSPFAIALDADTTRAPLHLTAVPGQDASTYRVTFDLARSDRPVQVDAMDGSFSFQLEDLDADIYDLEVAQGPSLSGAPTSSATVSQALGIDVRTGDGSPIIPRVTDLEIQVPEPGDGAPSQADRIVTARAANGSWVPVTSTTREGEPTVTVSSQPGSARYYGALIDTTDPRIALPDDDPRRDSGSLAFRPVVSDDLSIGAVRVDAGDEGLVIDDERPFELVVDQDALDDGQALTFTAVDAAGNEATVDWQPGSIDEPLERTASDPEPSEESRSDDRTDPTSGGSIFQEAWVWGSAAVLAAVGVAAAIVKLR